jgi:hypothetical protein
MFVLQRPFGLLFVLTSFVGCAAKATHRVPMRKIVLLCRMFSDLICKARHSVGNAMLLRRRTVLFNARCPRQ